MTNDSWEANSDSMQGLESMGIPKPDNEQVHIQSRTNPLHKVSKQKVINPHSIRGLLFYWYDIISKINKGHNFPIKSF